MQIGGAGGCHPHRDRRTHNTSQRAIESILRRKFLTTPRREARVYAWPSVGEDVQRRFRSELAAADREPQSIAGHRIDEPGRIPRQQQSVGRRRVGRINRQRADDGRRRDETRA